MVQQIETKVKDIPLFREALISFKEPEEQLLNSKNFTIHSDPLIERYFNFVASHGRPEFEWTVIRSAFLWKLNVVIDDMKMAHLDESIKENSDDGRRLDNLIKFILLRAEKFEGVPFTIQRICELLTTPNKHYNSLGKFLRALEKTVNIISCIEPCGGGIINESSIEEPTDENEGIRVESSFIVRVDELEMDKVLPIKEAKPIVKQHNYFSPTKTSSNDQFAAPGLLSPKSNADLNDIVTYALPIGPTMPKSSTEDTKMDVSADDKE